MIKTVEKLKVALKVYWPLAAVTLFFSLFYITYINVFISDIGRHITNGQEILAGSRAVFTTNYYSYTQADFNFINHHWLFGVFAYTLHQLGGLSLLTWVNTILNTFAFIFILATAVRSLPNDVLLGKKKRSVACFLIASIAFFCMPLLTHRAEVRPESISLLFFSLYYFLFKTGLVRNSMWFVVLIVLLQILWVNTHLFFILGPLLAGFFLLRRLLVVLTEKLPAFTDKVLQFWFIFTSALFVVSLINPYGLQGLLAPTRIFDNYSYPVAENQSTIFMITYGARVELYGYIVMLSVLLVLFWVCLLITKKTTVKTSCAEFLLVLIFIFLANKINRMSPFLAVIALPFLARSGVSVILDVWHTQRQRLENNFSLMLASTGTFILLFLILKLGIFTPALTAIGSGALPNSELPTAFFLENNLEGPIFNNYDIGGYLIYNLFPQEKLFIDNRPEAYSAQFLKTEYSAALTDEAVWIEVLAKYDINTIFFYRHDQADGAQQFLYNRVVDEDWVPVFVDNYTLILVRNSEKNTEIIQNYELPRELFVIQSP